MRSLALAHYLAFYRYEIIFIMAKCLPEHNILLNDCPYRLIRIENEPGSDGDADATREMAERFKASWVILDGYEFREYFQSRLRSPVFRTLLLDDYNASRGYLVDLILNYNLYAKAEMYENRDLSSSLLLGPRYSILRPQFLSHLRKDPSDINATANVLVTIGGTDVLGRTSWVLDALNESGLEYCAVKVVLGSNGREKAASEITNKDNNRIELIHGTNDMPGLMIWADIAITAGGTTTYELLFIGTPFITILVAKNQLMNVQQMERLGISPWVDGRTDDEYDKLVATIRDVGRSSHRRIAMNRSGQALVDGFGGYRLASTILGINIWCRRVMDSDMELVWRWANDPIARKWSFSAEPIPWDDHVLWYRSQMADKSSILLLASTMNDEPLGTVRIDDVGQVGKVSVNINPDLRGHGFGSEVVGMGCRIASRELHLDRFEAYIQKGNVASLKTFKGVGFYELKMEMVDGAEYHHLLLGDERQ